MRVSPLFLVLRLFSVRSTRRIQRISANFSESQRELFGKVLARESSGCAHVCNKSRMIACERWKNTKTKFFGIDHRRRYFPRNTLETTWLLAFRAFKYFLWPDVSIVGRRIVGACTTASSVLSRISVASFLLSRFPCVQPFRTQITPFRNRRSPMGKFHGGKNRPDAENIDGRLRAARRTKIPF